MINFFRRLKTRFFSEVPLYSLDPNLPRYNFWAAGLNYEDRAEGVRSCTIQEVVCLVREPENPHDPNAVHIKRLNGKSIGFIGKLHSQKISDLISSGSIPGFAIVTQLKCDVENDIYGLRISLNLPNSAPTKQTSSKDVIQYALSQSEHGNDYLLLSCEDLTFNQVIALFRDNNLSIERTGTSYKPAQDGRQYDWYLLLENKEALRKAEALMHGYFSQIQEQSEQVFKEEYLELQEEEIERLKHLKDKLIAESKEFESVFNQLDIEKCEIEKKYKQAKEISEKLQNELAKNSQILEKTLKHIFPEIVFLPGSIDMMQQELKDYGNAVLKISQICTGTISQSKRIQAADKWYDTHFNTGVKNDGRIYFKKSGTKTLILVSLKDSQKKDLQVIKRY
tara:strand:+ start:3468 stop:4649 length:1182 start_codon:yes stop_codon:yes gene_type:complete